MNNIITLHKKGSEGLQEAIDRLLELDKQGKVSDFAMVYYGKPKEEDRDWSSGNIYHYWFGSTSSILVLGLVNHLAQIIDDYI